MKHLPDSTDLPLHPVLINARSTIWVLWKCAFYNKKNILKIETFNSSNSAKTPAVCLYNIYFLKKNNSICLVICNTKILLVVKFLETELKSVIARQQKAHSVKFTDTRDCTILLAFLCFLSYLRFERTLTVSQGDDDALVTLGKAIDYVNETESPFQPHIMVMSLENITTKHIPKLS